jgi:hypothetical protein
MFMKQDAQPDKKLAKKEYTIISQCPSCLLVMLQPPAKNAKPVKQHSIALFGDKVRKSKCIGCRQKEDGERLTV